MKNDVVDIVPYERRYHMGIVDCLQRNFPKLETMEPIQLSKWLDSIVMCDWSEDEETSKHGYVILHDNTVVGYCGVIMSNIQYAGKKFKYGNMTTWGVDEAYRFNSFKILTDILEQMDIVSDFTPSPIVEKINSRLYGFRYWSKKAYKFKFDNTIIDAEPGIRIIKMKEIVSWSDKIVEKYYKDHKKYGCEGFYISSNDQHEELYFMFYVPVLNSEWVNTVYVSDNNKFTRYLKQIIKEIYSDYRRGLICDEVFINQDLIDSYVTYVQADRSRMIYTKEKNVITPGLLYSELPVLRY